MKERIISELCKNKKKQSKVVELLDDYLRFKYSLEDIVKMPLIIHVIDNDVLLRRLDNYSVEELGVLRNEVATEILDYYTAYCYTYDKLRAALLELHYNLYNVIHLDLELAYEVYKKYGDKYPEVKEYIINSESEELFNLYVNDRYNLSETMSLKYEILELLLNDISVVELYKCLSSNDLAWLISKLTDTKNIEKMYELYTRVDSEHDKAMIFNLIFSNDDGKYIYKLLTECDLSSEQITLLEWKLKNVANKQYKYYYMFYKNRNFVLNSFISWSAFLLFISDFDDKEEILKIKENLEEELKGEFKYYESEFDKGTFKAIS